MDLIMQNLRVSKSEFKAKALELFRQVQATGEAIVVTDHGKPTLEVRPYHSHERKALDILRGSVVSYENATDPVDVKWESAS
jgi:prevent-host-death family protein